MGKRHDFATEDDLAGWEDKMKLLGLDIGTTSMCAVVMDKDTECVIKSVVIENGSFLVTEHAWEKLQDAECIVGKLKKVVRNLLSEYTDIAFIGLTGQMHGILYVDKNGNCVSPLYTWQDGRGTLPVFAGKTLGDLIYEETGEKVSTGYGWVTHLYNQKKGCVPEGAVVICTIADFFGMKLTGRAQPLVHPTMAASLGFFDIDRNDFQADVMEMLGIDRKIIPEVTEQITALGTFQGIPVYTAIGDNQASFLGAAGREQGTILINMGTGGQISVLSEEHVRISGIETRPFLGRNYLLVGASLCGGRAYAILEKFFREYMRAAGMEVCSQYEVMKRIAENSRASSLLRVRTTFQGTRANPDLKGSIEQIDEENFTPAALILGFLNGMVQELYDMYGTIIAESDIKAVRLVASGNGVRKNELLLEALKEIFKMEPELSRYREEAACGAAMCGKFFL